MILQVARNLFPSLHILDLKKKLKKKILWHLYYGIMNAMRRSNKIVVAGVVSHPYCILLSVLHMFVAHFTDDKEAQFAP